MAQVKERVKRTVKNNLAPDVALAQAEGTTTTPVGTPDNPSDKVLTLANFITICRFVLTMVFLVLSIRGEHRDVAVVCYIVAAITDFLDGWIARATQTVSWFGKVCDPIMDVILLFVGVIGLVVVGDLPPWVAVFVIGRDLILVGGIIYLRQFSKRPVDVIFIGKLGTALFMTGFCLVLANLLCITPPMFVDVSWLPGFNGQPVSVGIYLLYVGVVLSTITAVTYYRNGFAIKDRVLEERARQSAQEGR